MGHNATGVGSTRSDESIKQATGQIQLQERIIYAPATGYKKATCDQEAWVMQALYTISEHSYPSGIIGRIQFAKEEAALHQAAVEVLKVLGYTPCYENIKRLRSED